MKKIYFLPSAIILVFLFCWGCKNMPDKKETEKDQSIVEETKFDLSTQEGYENFLADWGIGIPENSTFKEVKKTNDGNYKIIYSVEPFDNIQDSLQIYYEGLFDKILLEKGWVKPKSGWDPHGTLYEKENQYFKFFILVSEQHNIFELAFKYGE